jgi:3-deoxy-manno-octulosonate cytidylyltransferase (CMP-KDO synthetase)
MTKPQPCYGIIPARYQSSRFPGKPLADILGKPMFWHVYQRALEADCFTRVVLATDDSRIRAAAEALGVPVLMTRPDHASGTDRVLEAAEALQVEEDGVVVNIQGDEPALDPAIFTDLLAPFADTAVRVTSPMSPITPEEAHNPDLVKVVAAANMDALYFSRALIPFYRGGATPEYFCHIGLYAFRMETLQQFVALGRGRLEAAEKLEQLRLLENGIPIRMVLTRHRSCGVDRPADLQKAETLLSQR